MAQPIIQIPITQQSTNTVTDTIIQTVSQIVSNNTIGQKISNAPSSIMQTVAQPQSAIGLFFPILIGLVVIGVVLYMSLTKKKSGNQNIVALIGQRYAGKTQLFMKLNGGKLFDTVPSIKNNQTSFKIPSSRKTYQLIDFCGDGISKDQLLHQQNYINLHTLIHVLDGTDATKLGDAALFMYRLLVNKQYQKRECNYVLLLNKSDNENFLTRVKIIKRLEDQIEHIKQSRKNSPQQSEQQEDYLKTTKQRFNLQKSGIKICVGSIKNGEIKDLQNLLEDIL